MARAFLLAPAAPVLPEPEPGAERLRGVAAGVEGPPALPALLPSALAAFSPFWTAFFSAWASALMERNWNWMPSLVDSPKYLAMSTRRGKC